MEYTLSKICEKKILKFITDISLEEYATSIIREINKAIDIINSFKDVNEPEEKRDYRIQNFQEIKHLDKISFTSFKNLIFTIPALMPLANLILKMHFYLLRLTKRDTIIDSIKIDFDGEKFLNELWDKNFYYREWYDYELEEIFPLISEYLQFNSNLQNKYMEIANLYKILEKTLYIPISRIEDRFILDTNNLLDIYCFTSDESDIFFDGCGPHYDESVQDKIEEIFNLNVLQPKQDTKTIQEAKIYIDAYNDYNSLKYEFNKIKFLLQYINTNTCVDKILKDMENKNLEEEEYEDYKNTIKYLFSCPIKSNNTNCVYFKKKYKCSNEKYNNEKCIMTYVFHKNPNLYKCINKTFEIRTDSKLTKLFDKYSLKEILFEIIKIKHPELKNKSDKTIANNFTNYDELVKKYKLHHKENTPQEIYRRWEIDDKEDFHRYEKELECINNLEELYQYFEQYSLNPDEKIYKLIARIESKISHFLNPQKNPELKFKQGFSPLLKNKMIK